MEVWQVVLTGVVYHPWHSVCAHCRPTDAHDHSDRIEHCCLVRRADSDGQKSTNTGYLFITELLSSKSPPFALRFSSSVPILLQRPSSVCHSRFQKKPTAVLHHRAATTVRTRTKLGNRAFSVPATWNSLPPSLRLIDSHLQFCEHINLHHFVWLLANC